MSAATAKATELAQTVYADFFAAVVEAHVLNEREGDLTDNAGERVAKGTHIDNRVVRLMAISGKGGWDADPAKNARYAKNTNVSLLDHLLSVVRGAMLLYALDCLGRNPDMDEARLKRHLRVIAALAFLHDLDKMLGLPRGDELQTGQVDAALDRYGIAAFLDAAQTRLDAEQIRYLIEKVEGSQAGRHFPATLPPRELETLPAYVGLADKLDGAWLSSEPEKGGVEGVLKRLREDQTLHGELLRQWRAVDIFDPHHPFLLDELQRWLSLHSLHLTGIPPLLELHQDGRLFVLLPEDFHSQVIDKAIASLCNGLPLQLELNISNRGMPALYNGTPDHASLQAFIDDLPARDLGRLFLVKAELQDILTSPLDETLTHVGLAPRWPKAAGALLSPYPDPAILEDNAKHILRRAAHMALLLNLNLGTVADIPDYAERERQLLHSFTQTRPDWLDSISDDFSRRVITSLWVSANTEEWTDAYEKIWGEMGLLQTWLEGTAEHPGFNRFITGKGAEVTARVANRLRQLLSQQRITAACETDNGHCLFTDEPLPLDDSIDQALGLYEVRVSAFSGRDNRTESVTTEKANTNVSAVSIAEHKLRAKAHERQGGKPDGVPALISSPSTIGLFGGLAMASDKAMDGMSVYDLSRQDVKKGRVFSGLEHYRGRYRIARFERVPEKTESQVDQLRLLLQSCRRVGRPIHVFRGLPVPQRAFFHYDAMPRMLAELVGGNSLRLEQIPIALKRLETARLLLESNGLGYETLRLYAAPATRFRAICLACCHLRDSDTKADELLAEYLTHRETHTMSTEDGVLVRLGESAATIQRKPFGQASTNEEMLVFNFCLDFAIGARSVGQTDAASLINGIASELEINLVRKQKAAARQHRDDKTLREGCLAVARQFVEQTWFGVLRGRAPTQRARRILGSIYRMAFLQAAQSNKPTDSNP